MSVLSAEQKADYERDGYLLVSGLIPAEIVSAAKARMDQMLQEPERKPFFGTEAFNDCYTEQLCAAAAELGGEAETRPYYPVTGAFVIVSQPSEGEWEWPQPHIDHAIKDHGHHVFPRPFRVASMLFLNDIAQHGGGTIVWPGSHRKIERLAQSDPKYYDLMFTLNSELDKAGLGEPVELTPRAGDILFYHYLCAHAGSKNVTDQPRLGMNYKW